MPFVGWLLGSQFEQYITKVDHWIAFGLLGIIGGKMLYESFQDDTEEVEDNADPLSTKSLTILAVISAMLLSSYKIILHLQRELLLREQKIRPVCLR